MSKVIWFILPLIVAKLAAYFNSFLIELSFYFDFSIRLANPTHSSNNPFKWLGWGEDLNSVEKRFNPLTSTLSNQPNFYPIEEYEINSVTLLDSHVITSEFLKWTNLCDAIKVIL